MTDTRQLWLGLLILVSLGTLGAYTLFGSDMNLFGSKLFIEVEFPEAKGARKGDPVMLAGTRVGRVTGVVFRPDMPDERRILVTMRIDEPIEIREGYEIAIQDATLLGGRLIAIEPGPYGATTVPVADGSVLVGSVPPDIFTAVGDLASAIGEESDSIQSFLRDLADFMTDLREGDAAGNLNRGLESFADAGESIAELSSGLERGEGTLGRLFVEDEFYENWNSVGANADELLVAAREGNGVIGRLVSDEALGARVDNTIGDFEAVAANVRELTDASASNASLVNRLFKDEQLGTDVADAAANIRDFSGRLANGDGTLAKLIDSSELYDTLVGVGQDLRVVTAKVSAGEGTVGRLIMSDEIYDELALALRTANRGLEDYREAAPITTFTSLIFAGF